MIGVHRYRDSETESDKRFQKKLHIAEQERYAAATPLSWFHSNIFSGLCFGLFKDAEPVRCYELNFNADRGKDFLDWLGKSTLDQADVSLRSREHPAFVLGRPATTSLKDELKRTCILIQIADYIETLNDHDDGGKIEQCKLPNGIEANEVSKDIGTTKESGRKRCFNKTIPSLEKRVNELEKELEEKEARIRNVTAFYNEKLTKIEAENINLKAELKEIQLELLQTQEELGRVNFENERSLNLEKHNVAFRQIFNLRMEKAVSSTDSGHSSCSSSDEGWVTPEEDSSVTDEEPPVNEGASGNNGNVRSVQESREESRDGAGVSLTNIPSTAVERSIYNNYKLLLLTISRLLLASDVSLFKQWARSEFSIQPVSNISEIFTAMDRERFITAVNLDQLRNFFEKIERIDVVHLIECFLQGDYAHLRNSSVTGFYNNYKNGSSITTNYSNNQNSVRNDRNGTASGVRLPAERNIGHGVSKNGPAHTLKCSAELPDGFNKWPSFVSNCGTESSQRTVASQVAGGPVVRDGTETSNDDTRREAIRGTIQSDVSDSGHRGNRGESGYSGLRGGNRGTRVDSGSNGQKLSKSERPATTSNRRPSRKDPGDDLGDDEEWLCNHYKRRCYVKFDCCNKFWPCHRCHNNQTKCGQTKLKSRDTKFVKCVSCGKEQQFGANGQYCIQCNAKFSNYFCAICKHLTGKDDHPYHCDKCGICRIHGDRSFHCDVCGVCLDVQLRGNHRCRAGSAHDECCICLEDAFTGCQILPCSHKVHKDCATQMIRSGITRCPICRESFAHKLERRTQPAKKPTGKI